MGSPDGEKRGSVIRGPLGADERCVMRRQGLQRQIDVALGAHEQRNALMQLRRLHVEDALAAVDGRTAGLLADERQWIRLVQQAQLPGWALRARRIAKHATA